MTITFQNSKLDPASFLLSVLPNLPPYYIPHSICLISNVVFMTTSSPSSPTEDLVGSNPLPQARRSCSDLIPKQLALLYQMSGTKGLECGFIWILSQNFICWATQQPEKKKKQEEAFSSLNEGSNQPSTIFSDTFLGRRLKIGEPKIMTVVHILEIESSFPSVLLVSILSSCVFFNR